VLFHWTNLSLFNWVILITCGLLLGIRKSGIAGSSLVVVPIMANVFGGKASTGIVLPMLLIADVFAVSYYYRYVKWRYILKLMPWTILGIFLALFCGNNISNEIFQKVMATTIFCAIFFMILRELNKRGRPFPNYWWIAMIFGIIGGFASMIGNVAGSIMATYLLSLNLPKYNFISTESWFFFSVNLLKIPLHIFIWETISLRTLTINIIIAPVIIFGVFIGIKIVKKIPERMYRVLIIAITLLSAVFLFK